jgi:phosphotransferase system, enzyme I, PtsP
MRKDNVDLICSIGELAGLFEKSTSLEHFLQNVVRIVAFHMRAAVCSVYLYDEKTQELVMTANQGLTAGSDVRLGLGEGLTGSALKELRPIREARAAQNPLYKFVPGIAEEKYEAFLAVPILRGLTRIGVLVVQDSVPDYFDENDTKALQAIAAQLATTIENAKLLMALYQREEATVAVPEPAASSVRETVPELRFIKGTPAAHGIALGRPTIFSEVGGAFVIDDSTDFSGVTHEDFDRSLKETVLQLEELQVAMEESSADVASMIFSAHLLIVKDDRFTGEMKSKINAGAPPHQAIREVVDHYVQLFASSPSPRLREKVQDVKDLGHRLLQNLRDDAEISVDYEGHIVIAGELLPSDVLKLSAQKAEGIVQVGGAVASHIAILARSLNLPMVMSEEKRLFELGSNQQLLIDGDHGNIYIDPDESIVRSFDALHEGRHEIEAQAARMKEESLTRDGTVVKVMANINMLSEITTARTLKAEGIGLYRSEFPFIIRSSFPSEEEQFRVYRIIIEKMEGREVLFRTLDVGGDKMLSYFPGVEESNPFLGLRAIRFSFRYQDIFRSQLRALLRAGADTTLKIMFPMISSVDDFFLARDIVHECITQLQEEGASFNTTPQLGAMIELPAAVEVANELAREADFLSIGGNDLVQYMLAVDRTNQHISDLYVSHHPAVLRALKRVVDAGRDHDIPVSFCGEMATDPKMLPFLVGIGLRRFSVESRTIPRIRETIAGLDTGETAAFAERVLRLGRITEVQEALQAM